MRCGFDVERLRRDYDEVADTDLRRLGGRVDADGAVSARALDGQPARPDRLDVVNPRVDRPDIVLCAGQDPRLDGSHGSGTDDGDLQSPRARR
jgi:hypothetical protein